MGFILGVLILGALLTVIFGRQVGAVFVTGSFGIVAVIIVIFLIMISPMIWTFFTAPSHSSSTSSSSSYSSPTSSYSQPTPNYPTAESQPPAPVATVQQPQATVLRSQGPSIGVQQCPLPPAVQQRLHITNGAGMYIEDVTADGPAAQAGLQVGDAVISMDRFWVTSDTFPQYEARKGAGQPIRLEVWRAGPGGKLYHWYPFVTPQ